MVLQGKEYSIEDFLKDVNFMCPKNFSIGYILVPETDELAKSSINGLASSGFEVEPVKVKDNNIYYCKKDPKEAHSFSKSNFGVNEPLMPMPKQVNPEVEQIADTTYIDNPFKGSAFKVVEKTNTCMKVMFRESKYGLSKNTLLVFKRV